MKDLEPRFRQKVADAERLESGSTNLVYLTDEGTVVKIFRDYSFDVAFTALGYLLGGEFKYLWAKDRIQNEIDARERMRGKIKFPELLGSGRKTIEYDFVEGEHLLDGLNSGQVNKEELGKELGSIMEEFDDSSVALVDWKLSNFILHDGDLYVIDFELSAIDPQKFDRKIEKWTLLMSAKTLKLEIFSEFIRGFESEYGKITGLLNQLISTCLAVGLVTVVDQEPSKLVNVARNFL